MNTRSQTLRPVCLYLLPVLLAVLSGFIPQARAAVDTWDGYYGATWDTTNTYWNWDGLTTTGTYTGGDGALFSDYAQANFSITVTGTVSPSSILVTSTIGRAWTIGGGAISGTGTI